MGNGVEYASTGIETASITLSGNLFQSGGSLTATGSASAKEKMEVSAYGIGAFGNLLQSGGSLTATGSASAEGGGFASGYGIFLGGNVTQSGGSLTATGSASAEGGGDATARGIFLGGNFTQSGGSLAATGSGTEGYGIWLVSEEDKRVGNFTQFGGSLTATGKNGGTGIYFGSGAFSQTGNGVILAQGEGGSGIKLWWSSFSQSGGTLTATGKNNGAGIYLNSGQFNQHGGSALLQGTGGPTSGYGLSLAFGNLNQYNGTLTAEGTGASGHGIYLSTGKFAKIGGTLTAQGADNGAGIYLASGNFAQSGGTLTAQGADSGAGIYLASGNFAQSGGTLTAQGADNGAGIYLASGNFAQSGGTFTATGKSSGKGLWLGGGALNLSGGTLTAQGANNGAGIYLTSGNFAQSGGTLTAQGDNFGSGIQLNSGTFTLSGGMLAAGSNSNGAGLVTGKFIQTGGLLELLPGDGIGTSMRIDPLGDSVAAFKAGATLLPVIDFTVQRTGLLEASSLSAVSIDPKAKLAPRGVTTLALEKGASTPQMLFLRSTSPITGKFIAPGSTTLTYTYMVTDNAHSLAVTREAWVSEVLGGLASSATGAIEENRRWILDNLGGPKEARYLSMAYDAVEFNLNEGDPENAAKSLSPWAATQLGNLALTNMDQALGAISSVLDKLSNQEGPAAISALAPEQTTAALAAAPAAGEGAANARDWAIWLTPLARFDRIGAKSASFDDLDGTSTGIAAGLARRMDFGTLAFGGFFLNGEFDGGNTDLDSTTFGLLAAWRSKPLAGEAAFSPWVELDLGYAYTSYDQEREDMFGFNNTSDLHQQSLRAGLSLGQDFYPDPALRLTPVIGLDYTFAHQSGYTEDGDFLPLSVDGDSLNSLRGKIGFTADWRALEYISLDAHAFYRYEFADTSVDVDSQFVNTPVGFIAEGEDYDRSSGNMGLGLSWHMSDSLSLRGGYDFTVGDHYQGHEVSAMLKWEF